ncbi:LOW QUALITY PROTEIN: spermatogenesis-associated protein 31D3-like [Arvicola amphibius]|uniref:LOW QUALITY PROTEIN: spermatogenesis-associated protein 31D3-like n=1 Tax=Arvicola amphibius TaxID=1047088 RepID=UPI001C0968C3|nr:LOW QUALITY PROTEIN: spermatogenesis-associated protein 31D3-like [Arvicola amphibius]
MENILSSLNILAETWLTFGSASYHIDLNYTLLGGLGLLLPCICYLTVKLVLQSLWRKKHTRKASHSAEDLGVSLGSGGLDILGGEAKPGSPTCSFYPCVNSCRRKPRKPGRLLKVMELAREQRREGNCRQPSKGDSFMPLLVPLPTYPMVPRDPMHPVLSLERPLGELDDAFHREPRHPDPLFSECPRGASKVSALLSQATPEDGAAAPSCLASRAPVAEGLLVLSPQLTVSQPGHPAPAIPHGPLPSSPSILSPKHFAPLENLLFPTPLGDFLKPEPTPPSSPEFPPDPTRPYTLASLPLPTKEAQDSEVVFPLEATRSLVSRPSEVSVNVPITTRTGYERQPAPDLSKQRPAAGEPLSSDLAHPFNQPLSDPHASQVPLRGDRLESGNFLAPDSDALVRLKRQDRKGGDFRTTSDQKSKESFIKSPHSLEKRSSAEPSANPQALASNKSKHMYQQVPHSKTSGDDAESKPSQLFWGPPSLHSEALHPTTPAESDRSPTPIYFNSMAEASMAITFPPAPLVTESQPQTWLQTQSRSDSQADSRTESQAQPQPHTPVLVLTHSPQSQLKVCGVQFHRTQEAQPLGPSETQRLEYNILKKEQEKVWGLPSVVQKSQDTFCPPPPKPSLVSRSFKSQTPRPILLGDFPLTNKLRKKLEHHLRKRLIQHRWGLPQRINESLSLMYPQSELMEPLEPGRSRGLSWISLFKHRGSMEVYATVLSGSGKSRNSTSEGHPLAGTEVKTQTYSQDTGQEDHPQSNLWEAPRNRLASALKKDQERLVGSRLDQLSSLSLVSQCQKRIENALEKHVHKKTQEIRKGQMPSAVEKSWLSINMPQPPPETTPGQLKDLAPLAGKEDALIKDQHGLSLGQSKEKVLEEHIKNFSRRMTFGLPQRVEESLESYMTQAEPSHYFSQFHTHPHTVAGVDSGQSSRFLQKHPSGDGMWTMNAVPTRGARLSASSPVSKIEPASEHKKGFVDKDLSIAQSGRELIQSRTLSPVDKSSLQQSGSDNRQSPELPVRPDGPTDETLASSTKTRGPRGQRLSWKDDSMTEGSTELLKRQKHPGLHPQSPKILTVPQDTCSPGSHENPCQAMQGMSVPHNPETSDSKSRVSRGVVLPSERGLCIQATGLHHVSSASEEMTSKHQGSSSGDRTTSQVLRVYLPTVGVSVEPGHGPWFPQHVSGKCQSQACPPAPKGVSPLPAESGKLGGGDANLGTSQTRGKRHSVQARAPKETHGHTSSLALSPKGQPPENQFTNQVKCFWQWMSPGRKHKGQERSSSPSVKGKSLVKERCEFFGNIEAQSCVRDPGVILRKQLGHRHGTVIPCPQATRPSLKGSEETWQAQEGPVKRHHSRGQAAHSQVQRVGSCSPGRGQTTPKRCGIAGKAEVVETSPIRASQGTRVPPKSSL